jgi:hypothetical protein
MLQMMQQISAQTQSLLSLLERNDFGASHNGMGILEVNKASLSFKFAGNT